MFDTTAWADGSHNYQITVTDSSDRSATSTVLTINISNTGPGVSWITSAGTTLSGEASIEAAASPAVTGTAYIKKWCITKDGSPLVRNDYTDGLEGLAEYSALTGCWTSDSAGRSLLRGKFPLSTTNWIDGSHSFQITVTDSSNRTATSAVLTIKTLNPRPIISLVGVTQGSIVSGTLSLSLNVTIPNGVTDLSVKSYCYKLNDSECAGSSGSFSIETTALINGNHSIAVSITDSFSRTVSLPSVLFTTKNSAASLSNAKGKFVSPSWSNKLVSVDILAKTKNTLEIELRYGTSASSLRRLSSLAPTGDRVTGLKPNTKYYFSVRALGANGNSKTVKFSLMSPKIPPKPKSTGGSGGGGGGGSVNVIGMRLDLALSLVGGMYSYDEYSGCSNKTMFGIVNTSNWRVVAVYGSTLYACKS